MPKTKISEFSATPGNNTDIDGINIAEGCAPSGINDAIRELMAQLKDFQAGTAGDSFNGPIGATTPAAGTFTNLSASGTFALTGDQVQISEGGTGQTTANAAFNALAPSQSTHAGKYLKTDGTNTSWDALDISTADITGTLPIANGGTGLTALGTGVQTALGIAVGSSGAFVTNGGALGTPSSGTVTNLTGTASININGTVGATTPTTGAFTTLSASGNITVSGGTANGVAYLNGSKVLTTGSALTFDGSSLGLGRVAAFLSGAGIEVYRNGVSTLRLSNITTGQENQVELSAETNGPFRFNSLNNKDFAWAFASIEQMRLTSTGLGIGTSSPTNKLTVDGNANITGNTTLGDATTDTVTVNGYMGVGGSGNSSYALNITSSALTGTGQWGVRSVPIATSASTTFVVGVGGIAGTSAASFTVADVYNLYAGNSSKGAGSTITNQHGVYIADQTQGTNNYGITSLVSSGSNKWNIYASGTANNAFAGSVRIGSTTAPTNALDVTGAMTVSGNTTLGDASTDTVTVNGYGAVGTPNNAIMWRLTGSGGFGGTTQIGFGAAHTGTSAGTSALIGYSSGLTTATASYTVANVYNFSAGDVTKGAGSTITNQHGVYIADQTQGTNNYGITSAVSSGTNKWNIYASGTAANYFAGNLGLGVTPSAWSSAWRAYGIAGGATLAGRSTNPDELYLSVNSYNDGAWKYIASDFATQYYQDAGTHVWRTAPSGTAGNTISFTQAMTLTSGGNLLVGTTTDPGGSGIIADANGNVRAIPRSGTAKTTSYTLVKGDVGEFIEVGSGGSVTIPDSVFATGDVVSVFNNTTGNITITCTITTAYIAGVDSDRASVTLATRGVATILFISGTVCVISGNVS